MTHGLKAARTAARLPECEEPLPDWECVGQKTKETVVGQANFTRESAPCVIEVFFKWKLFCTSTELAYRYF